MVLRQRRGGRQTVDAQEEEERRPEYAPEQGTECPICYEDLFTDEQGTLASNAAVAKLRCNHLCHSTCLKEASSKVLNANGQRHGSVPGFGHRAVCPVCRQPNTFWTEYTEAAAFPTFWIHRILACLEKIGPKRGPVKISIIRRILWKDLTLTDKQKTFLEKENCEGGKMGFEGAIVDGSGGVVQEEVNGGPANGGSITVYWKAGLWDIITDDTGAKLLWLSKWGPYPDYRWSDYTQYMAIMAFAFLLFCIGVFLSSRLAAR